MEMKDYLQGFASEGRLDSSGRFRLDVERAVELLGRHQLADPHAYVLTMVAAAVSGGASFLEVTYRRGRTRLRFDGRTLSRDALEHLPVFEGDRFERQFSLALVHGLATRPGWLHVHSGGAGASLSGYTRTDADSAHNQIDLGPPPPSLHGRLKRLLACPEERLLRSHCHLAPLRLTFNGQPINRALDFGTCLASTVVGEGVPELARLTSRLEPRRSAGRSDWCAHLVIGSAQRHKPAIVVGGVTFTPPFLLPYPGSRGLVYAPALPLDASRTRLVEGEALAQLRRELEAELDELALDLAVQGHNMFLAELLSRQVRRLRRGEDYPLGARLRQASLFTRADGSSATVGDLLDQLARDGYLGTSAQTWTGTAWDPHPVVCATASNLEALACFNCLPLDHLARANAIARLPEDEYLLRMPLAGCAGEVGLSETPHTPHFGVHLALPERAPESQAFTTMPTLYQALLWLRPAPAHLTDHLLAYFYQLATQPPGGTLREMLDPDKPVNRPLTRLPRGHNLPARVLKKLAQRVLLPTCGGETVSLDELVFRGPRLIRHDPGGPPHAVLITPEQWPFLGQLLPPPHDCRGLTGESSAYQACCRSASDFRTNLRKWVSSAHFLLALLDLPDCAAMVLLQELKVDLVRLHRLAAAKTREDEWVIWIVHQAADLGPKYLGQLTTDLLLRAMLQVKECDAQRCLTACGVNLAAWEQQRRLQTHLETIADLDRALNWRPNASELAARAECRMLRLELEQAETDAQQALALDPNSCVAHLVLSGVLGMRGDFARAIESTRKALEIDPYHTPAHLYLAEDLVLMGRLDEAESAAQAFLKLHPRSTHAVSSCLAQIAFARAHWPQALELSEQALKDEPDIGWALETRAHALRLLGRRADAIEAYGQFLERTTYPLLEYGVKERAQQAREWSRSLED